MRNFMVNQRDILKHFVIRPLRNKIELSIFSPDISISKLVEIIIPDSVRIQNLFRTHNQVGDYCQTRYCYNISFGLYEKADVLSFWPLHKNVACYRFLHILTEAKLFSSKPRPKNDPPLW